MFGCKLLFILSFQTLLGSFLLSTLEDFYVQTHFILLLQFSFQINHKCMKIRQADPKSVFYSCFIHITTFLL